MPYDTSSSVSEPSVRRSAAPAPIVTSSVESPLGFSIVVRAIERADRGRPSPTIPWGCWIFAGRAARSRSDNLIISTTEQHAALPYQGDGGSQRGGSILVEPSLR